MREICYNGARHACKKTRLLKEASFHCTGNGVLGYIQRLYPLRENKKPRVHYVRPIPRDRVMKPAFVSRECARNGFSLYGMCDASHTLHARKWGERGRSWQGSVQRSVTPFCICVGAGLVPALRGCWLAGACNAPLHVTILH